MVQQRLKIVAQPFLFNWYFRESADEKALVVIKKKSLTKKKKNPQTNSVVLAFNESSSDYSFPITGLCCNYFHLL